MANIGSLMIDIGANVARIQKDVDQIRGGFKKLDKDISGVNSTMNSLGNGIKAVGAAFAAYITFDAIVSGFKAVVNAANEADLAEAKLAATLRSTGGAAGLTMQELMDLSSSMQEMTTFGDDAIQTAESMMLTFTKINKDVFPRAIQLAADLSVGMGQDLKSSVVQIGKALNSPIEGISALTRVGVQFTEAQKKQIKSFVEMNDVVSAQKIILDELTTQFGGQAKAEAETFAGKLKQLKNTTGDLYEEIGRVITRNSFFVEALELGRKKIVELTGKVQENRQWLMELSRSGFMALLTAIEYSVEGLRAFHNGWIGLKVVAQTVLLAFSGALELIANMLAVVLAPLNLIFDGLVKIGALDVNPFASLQNFTAEFKSAMIDGMNELLSQIEPVNSAYDSIKNKLKEFKNELTGIAANHVDFTSSAVSGSNAAASADDEWAAVLEKLNKELEKRKDLIATGFEGSPIQPKASASATAPNTPPINITTISEDLAKETKAVDEYTKAVSTKYNTEIQYMLLMMDLQDEKSKNAVNNAMLEATAVESLNNVYSVAYQGMTDQILEFIETGKFSVSEFGKIVAQQVKIELAGLAARAAIWAIFMTATGFARLVFGDAPGASAAFTSAGYYAAVSAGAIAAAAGVQAISGGSSSDETDANLITDNNAEDIELSESASGTSSSDTSGTTSTQEITVNVYTLTGQIDGKAQEEIIRTINDAGKNKNLKIDVRAIEGMA